MFEQKYDSDVRLLLPGSGIALIFAMLFLGATAFVIVALLAVAIYPAYYAVAWAKGKRGPTTFFAAAGLSLGEFILALVIYWVVRRQDWHLLSGIGNVFFGYIFGWIVVFGILGFVGCNIYQARTRR